MVHTSFSTNRSLWASAASQNSVPKVISMKRRNWWQNQVYLCYKPICLHTIQYPSTHNKVRTNDELFFLDGSHPNSASTVSNPFRSSYFFLLGDTFLLPPPAVSPSSAPFSVARFTGSHVMYRQLQHSLTQRLVFALRVPRENPFRHIVKSNVDLTMQFWDGFYPITSTTWFHDDFNNFLNTYLACQLHWILPSP